MPTLDWIGKSKVVNHHLDVPYKTLEYVIFNNGTVQTEKIPYDGAPHVYRAVDQTYANGRYYFTID